MKSARNKFPPACKDYLSVDVLFPTAELCSRKRRLRVLDGWIRPPSPLTAQFLTLSEFYFFFVKLFLA